MDIQDLTQGATSTPEDAAKNIENSDFLSVDPNNYKEFKPELDAEVIQILKPNESTPTVRDFMAQSNEHTSIIANGKNEEDGIDDVSKMNIIERQIRFISDVVTDRRSNEREIVDMNLRRIDDPDGFSVDDQVKLWELNNKRNELLQRDYNLGELEQLPAEIISGAVDYLDGLRRNADIIAGFAGVGVGVGSIIAPFLGPAALAPIIAFGAQGAAAGIAAASFKDGYDFMVGTTYNELTNAVDEFGEPINIDNDTKANISRGVGVISGVMAAIVGRTIAKTTPFLSKLMSPKIVRQIVLDPGNAALRKTILNIGQAVGTGSIAGAVTEVARIIAEEMGQTYDGTEASFLNAIVNASDDLDKNTERIAKAATVGGLVAGALATGTGAIGFRTTKGEFVKAQEAQFQQAKGVKVKPPEALQTGDPDRPIIIDSDLGPNQPNPVAQSIKALQFQDTISGINEVSKSTNLNKVSPFQLTKMQEMIFAASGLKKLYFDIEDLREFVNDPNKSQMVNDILDTEKVLSGKTNGSVSVKPHEFMDVVKEFPEMMDIVKTSPEGPNANQAREFLENIQKARETRKELLEKLGTTELTEQDNQLLSKAIEPLKRANDIFGEEDYLNQPTFEQAIENIFTEKQAVKASLDHLKARRSVVKNINDAAEFEMDKVVDVNIELAREVQIEIETNKIANDPNVELVDRFTIPEKVKFITGQDPRRQGKPTVDLMAELIEPHTKKGFSPFAIDPRSLTNKLRNKFLKDKQLRKHKTFVQGGISLNESARLLGVTGDNDTKAGEVLLNILSKTPSREEVIKNQVALKDDEIKILARDNTDLNEVALIKDYSNLVSKHIAEMKFMRTVKWPTAKKGIVRISKPVPTPKKLIADARSAVSRTKVGDLNVNKWKVAERKSQRKAIDAIVKNEIILADDFKESAALAAALTRETHIAIGKVNRVFKQARQFNKPQVITELKEAGKLFTDAANDLLDSFKLNTSKKGLAEKGSFENFVIRQFEQGNGNFKIPDRLTDTRESANDLTVESVLLIGDRLKAIRHLAKNKNKLSKKFREKEISQTVESVARILHDTVINHPSYNPNRPVTVAAISNLIRGQHLIFGNLADFGAALTTVNQILIQLDQEIPGGLYNELLGEPLRAGLLGEKTDIQQLEKFMKKNINAFGLKEFRNLETTYVDIPEFEGITSLFNGTLTIGDLMVMQAHRGDPDGILNLENFGVSLEVIEKVLERELTEKHAIFIQNAMVSGLDTYKKRTNDLQIRTTGQGVDFIEGVSYTHRGKVYPGGYFRQRRQQDLNDKIQEQQAKLILDNSNITSGEKTLSYQGRHFAAETTNQSRLEERTGSKLPLNLSFSNVTKNYEEVISDLNYREVIQENLRLLRDPTIKEDIIRTVGLQKYNVLINVPIFIANKPVANSVNIFADQAGFFKKLISKFNSGFYVAALGAKASSLAIQPVAILQTVQRMGPNGTKHILSTLTTLMTNPYLINDFYKKAIEINPAIGFANDAIDDSLIKTLGDLMPSRDKFPELAKLQRGVDNLAKFSMSGFRIIDAYIKVPASLAPYQQFITGDAEGFPLSKLRTMKPDEIEQRAVSYARQISELTQTHSSDLDKNSIQLGPETSLAKAFTNFYNDLRNIFNNSVGKSRRVFWKGKEFFLDERGAPLPKGKGPGFESNPKNGTSFAGEAINMIMIAALSRMYADAVRGQESPFDQDFDFTTDEGRQEALEFTAKYLGSSLTNQFTGSLPVVRDVQFALGGEFSSNMRAVSIPITKGLTDIGSGVSGLSSLSDMLFFDGEELTDQQFKGLLYASSYLVRPWPVAGALKIQKFLDADDTTISVIDDLNEQIDKFIKRKEDTEFSPEFLKELENMKKTLISKTPSEIQKDIKSVIPEETIDIIGQVESQGQWWAKTPDSTAAGLYNFTEDKWSEIMLEAPELGLTDNGRVSKNTSQQERAMRWNTERNTKNLIENNIPINTETIYGSHVLGSEIYIEIHNAPAKKNIKKLLDDDLRKANPWLGKVKSAGQVKKLITERIKQ